jgi:hypothetical protein
MTSTRWDTNAKKLWVLRSLVALLLPKGEACAWHMSEMHRLRYELECDERGEPYDEEEDDETASL